MNVAPSSNKINDENSPLSKDSLGSSDKSKKNFATKNNMEIKQDETKLNIFKRLHNEKLRKASPRNNFIPSKQLIEQEELKECVFKPLLDENTEFLAIQKRGKVNHPENCLINDAKSRSIYKSNLYKSVYSN